MEMKNIIIIALVFLSVFINFLSFTKVQDWGDDFAGYVIQAKTVHYGSYSELESNIKRNDFILNYPWGFPVLISPVITFFANNIIVIKIYIYLFFIFSLIIVFYLFREEKETALLTILLLSSCPFFWDFKNYILADIQNLFFVLITLLVANRFLIKGHAIVNNYFTCFLIGALVFVSYMVRNQSLVLLPAIMLVQFIKSRRFFFRVKTLLQIGIPPVIFLLLLYISKRLIPIQSVSYLNQYTNLALGKTVWNNIFYYLKVWQELFAITDVIKNVNTIFTAFFLIIVFIGAIATLKKNILFIIFFGGSMLLVLISPFYQGVRYLIPLVPFLFYFFITGFRYVIFHFYMKHKLKQLAFYSVIGIISFLSIKTIAVYTYEASKSGEEAEGPYKKTSVAVLNFIRNNTNKNEIIGFCKPRAMLLYTGRNAVIPASYDECIKKKIDYLVYYKNAIGEQLPQDSIRSHASTFNEVFRNDDFIVFKKTGTNP
jgi:hypothetical protein